MAISFTYIIIGITVLFSLWGFQNQEVFEKFKHYPYMEKRASEYIRMLTGGFLHGDYMHLAFNMYTLFIFGEVVEHFFTSKFGSAGGTVYFLYYLVAIVVAGIYSYFKHQNNRGYSAIGASGAVSAILFTSILLHPNMGLMMMFIPIPIKGYIFGFLYLAYSQWASNNSNDNIGHDAHLYGALFGLVFPLLLEPSLLSSFIQKISSGY